VQKDFYRKQAKAIGNVVTGRSEGFWNFPNLELGIFLEPGDDKKTMWPHHSGFNPTDKFPNFPFSKFQNPSKRATARKALFLPPETTNSHDH
jgi:hypothetical protein